jgi:hypothetical protein
MGLNTTHGFWKGSYWEFMLWRVWRAFHKGMKKEGAVVTGRERSSRTITVNADNRDLQPSAGGLIGFVNEVNGPGAREVPEYTPTTAELLELIKYWELKFLDTEYFMFEHSQAGSREIRLGPYAARRVARIIELLGDEGEKGVRGVRDDFAKSVGSSNWEEFCRYRGLTNLQGAADGQ